MTSRLDNLVAYLRKEANAGHLDDLKDADLVISTLEDLKAMIGNTDLKEQIATQISHLVKRRHAHRGKPMLNCILYGPAGCGKTEIGKKLASIFSGLGYLRQPPRVVVASPSSSSDLIGSGLPLFIFLMSLFILKELVCWIGALIGWFMFVVLIVLLVVSVCYYYGQQQLTDTLRPWLESAGETALPAGEPEVLKVVSREDFIDTYVGGSDKRTLRLLEANRGKVLFIDEAYSLVMSGRDQFGLESTSTLNRYLSEHPEDIIVIFAGYKKDLQDGLFKYQPGLPRRCMFHFEMTGYTPEELFAIFQLQLKNKGYTLGEEAKSRALFLAHYDFFPSFGGDTERLTNFAILEHSADLVDGEEISYDQLVRGLALMKKNNINHDREGRQDTSLMDRLMAM